MAFDPIRKLAEAGNAVDMLTEEQKAAFSKLTEHEVEVLTSVQAKLAVVSAEVEGQDINLVRIG
ncbi:aroma-sacti cluster domain-containing protein [Saccharothrix sp. ST-888]|uniref:aroma-sacti cluster domain-containing protein n=1 Tax=Saccharothrix sp. ST-888 TaxID=1427391 RepID=UPI00069696E1|nr:aroma-sacti cluster domain-containing protein [Saccharothrix sp. ST-888]